ncbi:MAG: hypothetical protein PHX21_13595 [bacterium]|nr:hypothetical protein [bacterium]
MSEQNKCEHEWLPLGQTVEDLYKRPTDQINDSRRIIYGQRTIASIYCKKCGEIKEKEL